MTGVGHVTPVTPDVVRVDVPMTIGQDDVEAVSGERYVVVNPATGDAVGTAPRGRSADAARAVAAAESSIGGWKATTVRQRAAILEHGLENVTAIADELAALLTREQGKPLAEASTEIAGFVSRMRAFVRLAYSTEDGRIPVTPSLRPGKYGTVASPGVGIVVALVAWNFPIGLLAKKVAPALMAGGVVIIKPAFTTPLTTQRVVARLNEAGLPAGVLNCVTGRGDEIGAALVSHSEVARVHLTGNDVTGRQVRERAGASGPELFLELAGSDAMIVCADADLEKAWQAAVAGRYRNAGQACIAVKRLFVADEIYDDFVGELARRVRLREPGDGLQPAESPRVRMGPLHTAAACARVEAQLADAVRRGADLLVGGRRGAGETLTRGHFFEPTVAVNVPLDSRLVTEEVFGPVLPVFRTRHVEHAIELANRSPWDLNTSIWTGDREMVRRVAPTIRCRQLWINKLPFGFEHAA